MIEFANIEELVQAVEIEDILVHEERGRRVDHGEDVPTFENTPISAGFRTVPGGLGYRFRLVVPAPEAEYVADFEIIYTTGSTDEIVISRELSQEFANRVAIMAVYPYLRNSVHAAASRMALTRPMLPIVRQGMFESGDEMSNQEARNAFGDTRSELAE